MQRLYSIGILWVFAASLTSCLADDESNRDQKLISTFQIVRFPNDPCVGSNARNGTCYTSQECSDKSGTSSGSCADGFGVCCTFIISTCGSTTSENLTTWTQPSTVSSGTCALQVCPIDDSICSIRLDFTNFVITGPSTDSLARLQRRLGHPYHDLSTAVWTVSGSNTATTCQTDQFYMRSASPSNNPPVICGTSTGQHMYMEADADRCNELSFHLADAATATTQTTINKGVTTLATRTWDITITQIECTSLTNPPVGCTKYFWNAAGRATIVSHNYQQGNNFHLGQQHDRYCMRRERGMCVGCFSTAQTNFALSGRYAKAAHYTTAGGCCGYGSMTAYSAANAAAHQNDGLAIGGAANDGTNGLTQIGWDCIIIPGAFMNSNDGAPLAIQTAATMQQVLTSAITSITAGSGPQICGAGMGIGAGVANIKTNHWDVVANMQASGVAGGDAAIENLTVCTRSTPFMLEFMSDDLDGLGGLIGANAGNSEINNVLTNTGFSVDFVQQACT